MTDHRTSARGRGQSRRRFLVASGSTAVALILAQAVAAEAPPQHGQARNPRAAAGFTLNVNGRDHRVMLDVRTTLLDALREHLGLTGTACR